MGTTMSGRRKVLLMGKSGSGKSSMRAIIFKDQLAADTRRLPATIDVESSQVRFLGGLRLDLWDCGGQDSFMSSHLTSQSSTIFRAVYALIYIFDVESQDLLSADLVYFVRSLSALAQARASEGAHDKAHVFVLLHKMDLVPAASHQQRLDEFRTEVSRRASDAGWTDLHFFGTSIWNESLYRAWSIVTSHLLPSLRVLEEHLGNFMRATSAREVVLFERNTLLVIASSSDSDTDTEWDKRRFERISTMVKAFKLGCSRIRAPFKALSMRTSRYNAVLDALTGETLVLVIAPPAVQPAAIECNIKLARPHFEKLEATSVGLSRS